MAAKEERSDVIAYRRAMRPDHFTLAVWRVLRPAITCNMVWLVEPKVVIVPLFSRLDGNSLSPCPGRRAASPRVVHDSVPFL